MRESSVAERKTVGAWEALDTYSFEACYWVNSLRTTAGGSLDQLTRGNSLDIHGACMAAL